MVGEEITHHLSSTAPPPAPLPGARACSQPGGPKQPPPGTALKQPAVVYPWMKKVHVNSGKDRHRTAQSPPWPGGLSP